MLFRILDLMTMVIWLCLSNFTLHPSYEWDGVEGGPRNMTTACNQGQSALPSVLTDGKKDKSTG